MCVLAAGGPSNVYVLGRARGCDIRLKDRRISSEHCRVFCLESRETGRSMLKVCVCVQMYASTWGEGRVGVGAWLICLCLAP